MACQIKIDLIAFKFTPMFLYYFLSAVLIQTGLCFGYLGNDAIRAQTGMILNMNSVWYMRHRISDLRKSNLEKTNAC